MEQPQQPSSGEKCYLNIVTLNVLLKRVKLIIFSADLLNYLNQKIY